MKAQLHDADTRTAPTALSERPKQDLSKLKTGREDIAQSTQMNQRAAERSQGQPVKHQPVMVAKKPGRNDRVKVLNLQNGETKQLKYKQAEPLINSGAWQMIELD